MYFESGTQMSALLQNTGDDNSIFKRQREKYMKEITIKRWTKRKERRDRSRTEGSRREGSREERHRRARRTGTAAENTGIRKKPGEGSQGRPGRYEQQPVKPELPKRNIQNTSYRGRHLVVLIMVAVYLGFGVYYMDRFFPGTTVNGIDVSGKTVKEVENLVCKPGAGLCTAGA